MKVRLRLDIVDKIMSSKGWIYVKRETHNSTQSYDENYLGVIEIGKERNIAGDYKIINPLIIKGKAVGAGHFIPVEEVVIPEEFFEI